MKVLRRIGIILDHINSGCAVVAAILFAFLTLASSFEVVMRYLLNRPTSWTYETSEYAVAFLAFLGAPWLLKLEGHVSLDVVVDRVNKKHRALFRFINSVAGAVMCLIVAYIGVGVTWDFFRRGVLQPTVLEPPKFVLLAVVPISFILLCLQFVRRAYASRKTWKEAEN